MAGIYHRGRMRGGHMRVTGHVPLTGHVDPLDVNVYGKRYVHP